MFWTLYKVGLLNCTYIDEQNIFTSTIKISKIFKGYISFIYRSSNKFQISKVVITTCESLRKSSVYGVFLVRIFPHSDWIRRFTEISIFSPNAGKRGPDKLRIRTFFTQWMWWTPNPFGNQYCSINKPYRWKLISLNIALFTKALFCECTILYSTFTFP